MTLRQFESVLKEFQICGELGSGQDNLFPACNTAFSHRPKSAIVLSSVLLPSFQFSWSTLLHHCSISVKQFGSDKPSREDSEQLKIQQFLFFITGNRPQTVGPTVDSELNNNLPSNRRNRTQICT